MEGVIHISFTHSLHCIRYYDDHVSKASGKSLPVLPSTSILYWFGGSVATSKDLRLDRQLCNGQMSLMVNY